MRERKQAGFLWMDLSTSKVYGVSIAISGWLVEKGTELAPLPLITACNGVETETELRLSSCYEKGGGRDSFLNHSGN